MKKLGWLVMALTFGVLTACSPSKETSKVLESNDLKETYQKNIEILLPESSNLKETYQDSI